MADEQELLSEIEQILKLSDPNCVKATILLRRFERYFIAKLKALGYEQKDKPYPEALYSPGLEPCFWCKTPTHWIDIDYQGRVCSVKCLKEMAQDVKGLSQKDKCPRCGGKKQIIVSIGQQTEALEACPICTGTGEKNPSLIAGRVFSDKYLAKFGKEKKLDSPELREKIASWFNFQDKLTRATVEINERDSWLMAPLAEKCKWREKADQILPFFNKEIERMAPVLDFAFRVATVMDELKSSHVWFILGQAFEDAEEWSSAQEILDNILLQKTLKEGGK